MAQEPKICEQPDRGPTQSVPAEAPDDGAILRAINEGDLLHFDAFVDRYKGKLLRYIHHGVDDLHQAEDITQDVFLKAFRAAADGQYDGRASAAAWLFEIARNCVRDHLRGRAAEPAQLRNAGSVEPVAPPASRQPDSERRWDAGDILDHLPAEQREVMALKVFGELSFRQIAEAVGCPVATAKSRMRYALVKVRELLAHRGNIHHE